MSVWSLKRRVAYGGTFIVIVTLLFGGIFYKVFYHAPTCSDGILNGDETGVDCGGSCQLLCTSDSLRPVVLWSKIFNISGNLYTAAAYIENPNVNSSNPKAVYQFRIYDAAGKLITVRDGETTIPKNKKFAIFETGIVLSGAKPKSADLAFTSFASWQKDTSTEPKVNLSYGSLLDATTSPNILGTATNQSLTDISRLELSVFVSDGNGNAVAASRTYLDNLKRGESQDFIFTWPQPFPVGANFITVIYRAAN